MSQLLFHVIVAWGLRVVEQIQSNNNELISDEKW